VTRVRAAERRDQAIKLRLKGLGYTEIGAEMGCSRRSAYRMVSRAVELANVKRHETVEQMIVMELARLDELQRAVYDKAVGGETKAIETVLKIMERRARLRGLDQPTKVDTRSVYYTMGEAELVARARQMGLDVPEVLTQGGEGNENHKDLLPYTGGPDNTVIENPVTGPGGPPPPMSGGG